MRQANMDKFQCELTYIPFFLSCALTMRPSESDRYPIEVLSEWSSMDIIEEEKEEDGDDEEGKESVLKLFLMVKEEELDMSS